MLEVKLVVVGGATEGDEFQLELPAVLGRACEVTLPLPHPLVSRRHCELVDRDGSLLVRDLGSTNGTFVGSERITESVLEHGQLLTVGTVIFRAFHAGHPLPAVSTYPARHEVRDAGFTEGAEPTGQKQLIEII